MSSITAFYPFFLYQDGATAQDWLSEFFGCEKTVKVRSDDAKVVHAEIRFGSGNMLPGTKQVREYSVVGARNYAK